MDYTIKTYPGVERRGKPHSLLVWKGPGRAVVDFTVQIGGRNYTVEVKQADVERMIAYLAQQTPKPVSDPPINPRHVKAIHRVARFGEEVALADRPDKEEARYLRDTGLLYYEDSVEYEDGQIERLT